MKKQEVIKFTVIVAAVNIVTIFVLPKIVEKVFYSIARRHKKSSSNNELALPDKEVKL